MTQLQADDFATRWLAAWNAHDLGQILEHYAPDIAFSSPFAANLTGNDVVHGREALANYFALALGRFPDLHFADPRTFPGAQSVVLVYRSVSQLEAAEMMIFDADGLVCRVWAHYRAAME